MSPPAMLAALPAAPATNAAPPPAAPLARADGSADFSQRLQAARGAPGTAPPPAAPSPTAAPPRPAGRTAAGDPAAATPPRAAAADAGGAKPNEDATMSNVPATTPSAPNAAPEPGAAPAADPALVDAALAAAQATAQLAAGSVAAPAPAPPRAQDAPADEEGAAALAGAMLAMLGQVNGVVPTACPAAPGTGVPAAGGDRTAPTGAPQGALLDTLAADAKSTSGAASNAAANAAVVAAPTMAGGPVAPAPNFAAMLAGSGVPQAATDAPKDTALQALALATAPLAPSPAPPLPALQVMTPPGQPGFANELGQQVIWLGRQDIQSAKIRLHPEDLGTLDVHLDLSHDRVDVVFAAQHPAAVAAVQQSLPQLQQMLAQHGLALGHAEVGQQQQGNAHAHGHRHAAAAPEDRGEVAAIGSVPVASSQVGLLDAFA